MSNTYILKTRSYFLADSPAEEQNDRELLEKYFNDLYPFFLKKLTFYMTHNSTDTNEEEQLKKMLEELINVRRSINR